LWSRRFLAIVLGLVGYCIQSAPRWKEELALASAARARAYAEDDRRQARLHCDAALSPFDDKINALVANFAGSLWRRAERTEHFD